jgi:hypothetical protein
MVAGRVRDGADGAARGGSCTAHVRLDPADVVASK